MIEAARGVEQEGFKVTVKVERAYEGYLVPASDPLVRLLKKAGAAEGLRMRVCASGGGSDANFLNTRGVKAVVLNTGAFNPHSEKEYLDLAEFRRASAVCKRAVELFAGKGGERLG
jgi:tripeptide aminopeptidase